jgi:heme o synthase
MFLICSGSAGLLVTGRPLATLLGLAAVSWYNGFYTWFKTCNRFAAIPGALVGAIPPAIGWIAGGGNIFDIRLAAICFFFFMWQVLHFFIHMLAYGKEYEKAGLPSLSTMFTEFQLDRLTFQWLLALVVSTQFIILFGVIHSPLTHAAIIAASLWLALNGITFIRKHGNIYAGLFRRTNYYMLLVMLLMTLDGLFRSPAAEYFNEIVKTIN